MAQLWQDFLDAPGYFEYSPWFPNPLIAYRDMTVAGFHETVNRLPWQGIGVWLAETKDWADKTVYFDVSTVAMPLLMGVLLTLLRVILNWTLFNVSSLLLPWFALPWFSCVGTLRYVVLNLAHGTC